jgi:hypothetical protein
MLLLVQQDLRINALPVLSSDHYQFVKELKQSISDSRNLKDIALKTNGNSVRSGILTSL